jgi:hypothetical protein
MSGRSQACSRSSHIAEVIYVPFGLASSRAQLSGTRLTGGPERPLMIQHLGTARSSKPLRTTRDSSIYTCLSCG